MEQTVERLFGGPPWWPVSAEHFNLKSEEIHPRRMVVEDKADKIKFSLMGWMMKYFFD